MKKADHFAEFRRLPTEIAGNEGNRETAPERPKETRSFPFGGCVTRVREPRVTRVTQAAAGCPDLSVTHVTHTPTTRVTEREPQKTKPNNGNSESVTHVTRVTHENNGDGRLSSESPFDDSAAFTTETRAQEEAEMECLAAADGVVLLADAIASAPRSPFLDDLAMARTVARFAVTTGRLPRELTGARLGEAQTLCADTARAAANHIRRRDYFEAYELLDELPAKLRALIPQ